VPAVQNALKLSHLSCRFKLAVAADAAAAAAALAALHKLLCNPFNLLHTFRRKLNNKLYVAATTRAKKLSGFLISMLNCTLNISFVFFLSIHS